MAIFIHVEALENPLLLSQIKCDRHKISNFILFKDYSVNVSKI